MAPNDGRDTDALDTAELQRGFHEAHRRIGASASSSVNAAANAYALAELLVKKGLIGLDELEASRRAIESRLQERMQDTMTVKLAADAPDKYEMAEQTVEIDCENRVHLCKAACCRLRFALSEQDVVEGVVNWNIAQPYLNRQRPDGYCAHSDPATLRCGVYANRPSVCRAYDCRKDSRIWIDFEKRIPNPRLMELTHADGAPPVVEQPNEAPPT